MYGSISLELSGSIDQGKAGMLRVRRGSTACRTSRSPSPSDEQYETAELAALGEAVRMTTGTGSHLDIGQGAVIFGAENATLAVGMVDSLLILPTGASFADFASQFAAVEHHQLVVATREQPLQVGSAQRVQFGGTRWNESLVVEGYAYDLPGLSFDLFGGLTVEPGGRLELGHDSEVFVEEGQNSAVRGGVATVGAHAIARAGRARRRAAGSVDGRQLPAGSTATTITT